MQTKIVIDAGSLDDMQRLVGIYDENLNIVTRELCVSASVEGVRLKISGEEGNVALAARVLEGILKLIRAGEPVDKTRIVYCIELAREGNLEGIEQVMSDVVAITSRGKQIKCKTVGQKKYVDAIKKNTVVFGIGPAGTGKTYLAVCLAAGALKGKQVEKIILTRPAVEAGEKLGFLPGDLQTKVDPYLRPLYDALQEMFGLETYAKLMEKGVIEVAPLAYMRGRTLSNAFIILDEAQNTTCEQMKMFLTRMGEGSKVVVTGDVTQIDLPEGKRSGLKHAVSVLKNIEGVETVTLTAKDVVRHPLVMAIVHAYERDAARREYIREERKKK
ncbi:MAG TPA: PhoH family protein [Candidatus Borkfalkia faecavium]|uniref:PhoH-like protein n=1 Tax=Candidatus Borkfalkia faecavium TaxID=2838508 RepID=A0A9D1W1M9_9FIRM|nr:PhoH family protein [Candidatus Borkfalkia faecavium]